MFPVLDFRVTTREVKIAACGMSGRDQSGLGDVVTAGAVLGAYLEILESNHSQSHGFFVATFFLVWLAKVRPRTMAALAADSEVDVPTFLP